MPEKPISSQLRVDRAPLDVVAPPLQVEGQAGYFPSVSSPALATARPVFVVGSPRSGTSILTWCLGQHSNILVQEESSWIGPFALQIEIAYGIGTARGERSQLCALDVTRDDFFRAFGRTINQLILDHLVKAQANARARVEGLTSVVRTPAAASSNFQILRSPTDPKMRWVDGTPEYSFYINPLRKLFPEARFIHVVRNVTSVVHSMIHFERTGGPACVGNVDEAFDYWLRSVRACLQAEHAYGSDVIRRLHYADLVADPKQALAGLFDFLSEDFEPSCLEPLQHRINSSGMTADPGSVYSQAKLETVVAAAELTAELVLRPMTLAPDPIEAEELEDSFRKAVNYLADLLPANRRLREQIAQLEQATLSLKAEPPSAELPSGG